MWRWFVLFGLSAVFSAIALFPLGLALSLSGAPVTAEQVSGTVWNGRLEGASTQGYALGDIDVSARFIPLLTGRLQTGVKINGPIVNGDAVVTARPGSLRFDETEARVNIAALQLKDAFGAPMSGMVDFTANKLILTEQGRCLDGRVSVWTDTLQRSAVRYGGQGFLLSGEGACEDEGLVLPLNGIGPEGRAEVTIRVSRSGYQTELVIEPTDQQLADALSAYGFEQRGRQYSLIQRGDVF